MTEATPILQSGVEDNASTTFLPTVEIWVMPGNIWASGVALTGIELLLALFANILLVTTIYNSPSLRTPPNIQLVSVVKGIRTFG